VLDFAPPALRAAGGLDRANREPVLAIIDGCHTQLDDVERRRYCLIIFAGCTVSSLHIARCGARSDRRSQATVRSPLLKPHPGRLFVRRHVRKPAIEPDCPSASGHVQIRES
jgi:hypothetical protein